MRHERPRRLFLAATAMAALALSAGSALATAAYPARTVTMVVAIRPAATPTPWPGSMPTSCRRA